MRRLTVFVCVVFFVGLPGQLVADAGEGWQPVTWEGVGSTGLGPGEQSVIEKLERVLEMFRRNVALNPPGRLTIRPSAGIMPGASLPGGATGPVSAHLSVSMWEPAPVVYPSAVRVRINEPYHLLGEPLVTDEAGGIYLLPPEIPHKSGQALRSRDAHPPGYEERYPSDSFFRLWAHDVAPFLRSIVRPAFGLAEPSVTTVFTKGRRPFWKPVTQERWILALIALAQAQIDEFQAGLGGASDARLTQQQVDQMRRYMDHIIALFDEQAVIERHEQSIQNAEQMLETARAIYPPAKIEEAEADLQAKVFDGADARLEEALAAAAEGRAELEVYQERLLQALLGREEVWTEANAAVTSRDWDRLESLGEELDVQSLVSLADAGRSASALEAELAALSPAERRAPAWGFELPPWHPLGPHRHVVAMPFEPARASGLVAPGTAGARALVSVDPAFFTASGTPAPVQLLTVTWHEGRDALYHREGGPARGEPGTPLLDALWNSMDWPMLRGMVE